MAVAADCKGINGVSNLGDETSLSGKTAAAAWVGKRLLEVEAGLKVCGRRFFCGGTESTFSLRDQKEMK